MSKKYNFKNIEIEMNKFHKENNFVSELNKNSKKEFTTILPPPNVTGSLHLGHAWDGVLPDFLLRYNILMGNRAIWYPGKDHAGIATQSKIEQILFEKKKLKKEDLGREKFNSEILNFVKDSSSRIDFQWEKLGLLLNYEKEKFTLDLDVQDLVSKTFIDYYNQKIIYRDTKLVNWDTKLETVISNIESEYRDIKGNLYYIKYKLKDLNDEIIVATTRPETMFADVAIFVNPDDMKYKKFINKEVINPSNNEIIKIYSDKYVDINFGTGAIKVTPGHDFNDYDLALKYKLEIKNCFNKDGTLNKLGGEFMNLKISDARKKLIIKLKDKKAISKIEAHNYKAAFSSRSNSLLEPVISNQWFLKFPEEIIKKARDFVGKELNFYPKRFNNEFINWIDNLHEWCISRQLWWGHQIPVWYKKSDNKIHVSKKAPLNLKGWVRDSDVLDTWFSSSLWPIVHFDADKRQLPSSLMITGYDLIFFWVSKMILQSILIKDKLPFNDVLLHGIFRDEKGEKMSKSKGNGIDPLKLIDKYGSDALRFYLLNNTTPGADLNFNEKKLVDSWGFINKLWNVFILMDLKVKDKKLVKLDSSNLKEIDIYIIKKYNLLYKNIQKNIKEYEISKSSSNIYNFIYFDFSNFYLEIIKKELDNPKRSNIIFSIFVEILKLLYPYIPIITEKIFRDLKLSDSILKEKIKLIPEPKSKENIFESIREIQYQVRRYKSNNKIKESEKIPVLSNNVKINEIIYEYLNRDIKEVTDEKEISFKFLISNNIHIEIYKTERDDSEIKKRLKFSEFELERANRNIENKDFIKNAPKKLVDIEKEKIKRFSKEVIELRDLINLK